MKRKIFLITAMVALLVCAFALTVSAAGEVTLENGTKADLETVFKVSDNTISGFNDGYSKSNIKDVVFPAYITTIKSISFESSTVIETVTFESSTSLTLDSVTFKQSSVKKVTFNPDCVLNYKSGNFYNCQSLTEITFPKFLALPGGCFQSNKFMQPTNEIVFVEGVTKIASNVFLGCSKVGGDVVLPSTVTEIKEDAFNGTSISSFDFSKCVNLTTIGGGYGRTFSNIDTITSYDFSACTNLTTFNGGSMFEGSEALVSVVLPANLTTIPSKTFAHCYKMQSIVIPATVTDIAIESFHSARRGQSVMTFTMYIQGDVKLNTKQVFRDSGAKIEFVLIGDGITATQFKTTNAGIDIVQSGSHSPLDDIGVIDYLDPISPWTFVPGQARTSHIIVDNYCMPLALTGEHQSEDNPCVINCSVCGLTSMKENPQHAISTTINYEGGYDKTGVKLISCTNLGCSYEEATSTESLFVCLGYSAAENGNVGIAVGFKVNSEAITEYKTVTGKTLKYGVFAVSQEKLGDAEIFGENGATSGVLSADVTVHGFNMFELKIVGFTNEQKNKTLAMGAYVKVTDGEKTTYSYIQDDSKGELNGKYYFASYNDIVGMPSEK